MLGLMTYLTRVNYHLINFEFHESKLDRTINCVIYDW